MRTARGRVATRSAYLHFGLAAPAREPAADRDPNLPLFKGPGGPEGEAH